PATVKCCDVESSWWVAAWTIWAGLDADVAVDGEPHAASARSAGSSRTGRRCMGIDCTADIPDRRSRVGQELSGRVTASHDLRGRGPSSTLTELHRPSSFVARGADRIAALAGGPRRRPGE